MHPRSTPTRWETRVGGPGLTALLLPHIFPICSVVAPLRRGPHGADCAPWGGSAGRRPRCDAGLSPRAVKGPISSRGRWMAYTSDESGQQFEVYVRPFPTGDGE